MQMTLTGSIRVSLEKWLTFPHGKDSLHPWSGLFSQSLWSVSSLSCLGHWGYQFRSHTQEAVNLRAGHPEMMMFCRMLGRKWLSLVGVASIKRQGDGRGCQENRVCIQRPQLLLWKSYQMDHQLPHFSHSDSCLCHRKIFYRAATGGEGSCMVVMTYVQGEDDSEWAWSFAPDPPVLGFTQISLRDLTCAYGWPSSCP